MPLFRLNKRQGAALLAELGADKALYEKVPTADLEEDKPGIADEVALGVTIVKLMTTLKARRSAKAQGTELSLGGVKVNTNVTCQSPFLMILEIRGEMSYD